MPGKIHGGYAFVVFLAAALTARSGEIFLQPGQNWIALWGAPAVNEVGAVLGHDLPAGDEPLRSTRVMICRDGVFPHVQTELWLARGAPNQWRTVATGEPAETTPLPLGRGFVVAVPVEAASQRIEVTLQPVEEKAKIELAGNGAYNVVGLLGEARPLGKSGLREAGFSAAAFDPNQSDEVRILEKGLGENSSPKCRILLDPADRLFKYWTGGPRGESAEDFLLTPGEAFIVYTRHSTTPLHWLP